jgi:polyferredoxin
MQTTPDLLSIGIVAALAAVVAYFVTRWIGEGLRRLRKPRAKADPWAWQWGLRLLAVLIGALVGAALYGSSVGPAWPYGVMIGASAGTLCTTIVGALRARIPSLPVGVDQVEQDDDQPGAMGAGGEP